MKKIKKILLLILLSILLIGCDFSQAAKFQVVFEENGGSEVEDQEVYRYVKKTFDPTREGYTFCGWYLDSEFQYEFSFDSIINSDVTLYAKWQEKKADDIDDDKDKDNDEEEVLIDKYFLGKTLNKTITSSSQLTQYLDYMIFNKIVQDKITIEYTFSSFDDEINKALDNRKINSSVLLNFNMTNKLLTVTCTFPEEATTSSTTITKMNQTDSVFNNFSSSRTQEFNNFYIESITKTYPVTTTDQLVYILERGYKPAFTENASNAKTIYEQAKDILRTIVDDEMTDIQKVIKIHDWLIMNVAYDNDLLNLVLENAKDIKKYNGFYLEGAFLDKKAVCDGISKAMVLLLNIEGIRCVQVTGTSKSNGSGHAWNKVYLNNSWYVVDATGDGIIVNDTSEVLSHQKLLITDEKMHQEYLPDNFTDLVCNSEINVYKELKFTYNEVQYDFYIENENEFIQLLKYYKELNQPLKAIDFYLGYGGDNSFVSLFSSANSSVRLNVSSYMDNNRYINILGYN